jgi:hypothetical protein
MNHTFNIGDKKYISAKRVHELYGYTSDYVGQLCRAGKLDSKMLGRSWFVNEDSIINYKLAIADANDEDDEVAGDTVLPKKEVIDSPKEIKSEYVSTEDVAKENNLVEEKDYILDEQKENVIEIRKVDEKVENTENVDDEKESIFNNAKSFKVAQIIEIPKSYSKTKTNYFSSKTFAAALLLFISVSSFGYASFIKYPQVGEGLNNIKENIFNIGESSYEISKDTIYSVSDISHDAYLALTRILNNYGDYAHNTLSNISDSVSNGINSTSENISEQSASVFSSIGEGFVSFGRSIRTVARNFLGIEDNVFVQAPFSAKEEYNNTVATSSTIYRNTNNIVTTKVVEKPIYVSTGVNQKYVDDNMNNLRNELSGLATHEVRQTDVIYNSIGRSVTDTATELTNTFNTNITNAVSGGTRDFSGANLSISGTSTIGSLIAGSTTLESLFMNGSIYLTNITPSVTNNLLYANSDNLYWAGNLIGGATTGNWTTDGTNAWRATGNVGMGTTTPAYKLDINAGNNARGLNIVNSRTLHGSNIYGQYTSASMYNSFQDSDVYGSYVESGGTALNAYGVYSKINPFASDIGGAYGVYSDTTSVSLATSPAGIYSIYGISSNTGGTGVYGSGLYGVQGVSNSATGYGAHFTQSNANGYAVYSTGGKNYFSGNVGIGSSTPSSKLTVIGDGYFSGNITGANITATGTLAVTSTTTTGGLSVGSLSGLLWGTNGAVSAVATSSLSINTNNLVEGSNLFYTDVRASTTARNSISNTATGLTYTPSTGILSLTSLYNIPLFASTTDWNTSYINRITSATSPISILNNTISMTQSTTGVNGWLSSTDWNTFNNKASTTVSNTWSGVQTFNNASTTNLSVSSNAYMPGSGIWNSSGNVGIGTTVPLSKLNVQADNTSSDWQQGQIVISGASNSNQRLYLGYDTVNDRGFIQAGKLGDNYKNLLLNSQGGNVGIGTTSPLAKLDTNGVLAVSGGSGSTATNGLQMYFNSNTGYITSTQSGVGNRNLDIQGLNINFRADGANAMIINNLGNVGIGTTTPGVKLDVHSGANTFFSQLGNNLGSFLLASDASTNYLESVNLNNNGVKNLYIGGYGINSPSQIEIEGTSIYMNGNVGIGTTSPAAKLTVKGSGLTTGVNFQTTNSNNVPLITALDNGNVGIGTTTPGKALVVNSTALGTTGLGGIILSGAGTSYNLYNASNNTTSGGSAYFGVTDSAGINTITNGLAYATALFSNNSTALQLGTNGAARMTIDTTGNVGIGTTGPGAKLDVNGTAWIGTNSSIYSELNGSGTYAMLRARNAADSTQQLILNGNPLVFDIATVEKMRIDTTGNVGIGTTGPGNKLSVNGNVSLVSGGFIGFTGDTAVADTNYALYGTGSNTLLNVATGGSIGLRVGNSDKMVITSTGNVGIGTTAPLGKLFINPGIVTTAGAFASSALNIDSAGTTGALSQIGFGYSAGSTLTNTTAYIGLVTTYPAGNAYGDLVFGTRPVSTDTAPTERLRITSQGNVGIGTTSPTSRLYVSGDASTNFVIDGTSQAYQTYAIGAVAKAYQGYGNSGLGYSHPTGLFFSTPDTISFGLNGGASPWVTMTSGNVGIGTTTPVSKLSVLGESAFAGGASVGIGYAGTTAPVGGLIIQGNVGIGTVSPGAKLTIAAGASDVDTENIRFNRTTDGNRYNSIFSNSSDSAAAAHMSFRVHDAVSAASQSTVMTLRGTGNVGIGTTSPSHALTVQTAGAGNSAISLSSSAFGGIVSADAGNLYLIPKNPTVTIISDGNTANNTSLEMYGGSAIVNKLMTSGASYINGGNVGIGTTSPETTLHVVSAAFGVNPVSIFRRSGSAGAVALGSDNVMSGSSADALIFPYNDTGRTGGVAMYYTNGSTKTFAMGINNTGNVGIGTTAPGNALHVLTADSPVSGTTGGISVIGGTGLQVVGQGGVLRLGGITGAYTNGWPLAAVKGVWETATGGNYSGALTFATANSSGTGNEWMRITSQGNVGIGTTSPGAKLHILNIAAASVNGQEVLRLDATNAGAIVGSGALLGFYTAGTVKVGSIRSYTEDSNNAGLLFSTFGSAANVDSLYIKGNGNVGIGTTSPQVKLSVVGDIAVASSTVPSTDYSNQIVCYVKVGNTLNVLGHMTQAALLAGAGSAACIAN